MSIYNLLFSELSPADTFIGFREDTPAVIVLQVTRELEADMDDPAWDDEVEAIQLFICFLFFKY